MKQKQKTSAQQNMRPGPLESRSSRACRKSSEIWPWDSFDDHNFVSLFYLILQFSKPGLQLWLVARLHVEFILDTMSQHMIVIHTFLVSGWGFSSTRVQVAQCKTHCSMFAPLCLYSGSANDFLYTRQGRSPVIDGVDDTKELCTTRNAFSLLGNSHT